MLSPSSQLPLQIQLNDSATFANFFAEGKNAQVVSALQDFDKSAEQFIYLYGQQGVGCSHLLQASCHQQAAQGKQTLYLPLGELLPYPPEDILEGLENIFLLCLDDVELICGNKKWEEALFHLFNRARETGLKLLMSASMAPRQLPLALADLSSRLSWGLVYQLEPLDDGQKIALLQLRAKRRGLTLSEEVAQFVVARSARDVNALLSVLDKLDKASLIHRRRLTIPFVKETLSW